MTIGLCLNGYEVGSVYRPLESGDVVALEIEGIRVFRNEMIKEYYFKNTVGKYI